MAMSIKKWADNWQTVYRWLTSRCKCANTIHHTFSQLWFNVGEVAQHECNIALIDRVQYLVC